MATAPIVCPQCGRADMIVKVTSPQAPRALPMNDFEITHAAQQYNPALSIAPPAPPASRSGCIIAVLIVLGIVLFVTGAIYGAYHPGCPIGQLEEEYIVSGAAFIPHCISNGVEYPVQPEYINPGGGFIGPLLAWGGIGIFLWGCILPIVRWNQRRNQRQQFQAQMQAAGSQQAAQQQALSALVGQARNRVATAYYCGRDDGFFIPGSPQFYSRVEWAHFLFG